MPKLHLGCGNFKLDEYINIDISSKIADLNLNMNDYLYLKIPVLKKFIVVMF